VQILDGHAYYLCKNPWYKRDDTDRDKALPRNPKCVLIRQCIK